MISSRDIILSGGYGASYSNVDYYQGTDYLFHNDDSVPCFMQFLHTICVVIMTVQPTFADF
jgi:hypothetical protein